MPKFKNIFLGLESYLGASIQCYCENIFGTGLMRDDTLYEDDDVKEALKRLPEDLYNERMFRIKRALDLSLKHRILPKEQWVKYEEVSVQSVLKVLLMTGL